MSGRINGGLAEDRTTRRLGVLWLTGGLLAFGWGLAAVGPDG